jgi:hypothetical protein
MRGKRGKVGGLDRGSGWTNCGDGPRSDGGFALFSMKNAVWALPCGWRGEFCVPGPVPIVKQREINLVNEFPRFDGALNELVGTARLSFRCKAGGAPEAAALPRSIAVVPARTGNSGPRARTGERTSEKQRVARDFWDWLPGCDGAGGFRLP